MEEILVSEAAAQQTTVTELALELVLVDKEAVDMVAETGDSAVEVSGEPPDDWARVVDFGLVPLQDSLEGVD